jgi:opacity protein-like surface antigen
MRNLLCGLALATVAFAAPASARDGQFYAGIDIGVWSIPDIKSTGPEFEGGFPFPPLITAAVVTAADSNRERVSGDFKRGTDLDLVFGYDFGRVRLEGELSRKKADFDKVTIRNSFLGGFLDGTTDTKGSIRARTAVVNVLYDLPLTQSVNLYAGPGVGYGSLKLTPKVDLFENGEFGDELHRTKRKGVFGQLVGGVRVALSDSIDAGIKYRYIRSEKLSYDAGVLGDLKGRLKTHSLLASLAYNFGGHAPAPVQAPVAPAAPVAEPAPATQTCADGSVILASDACPVAQPTAPVTSGERG